jgi:hypothetical protein
MQTLNSLLVSCGLTFGLALVPLGSANAQGVAASEVGSDSVELGNVSGTDSQEPVAGAAGADGAGQTADAANAEEQKDPREQYRDKMMKEPEGQPLSATSAVSRRYKKMDKATYQATMLEPAAQTEPAQQGGSSAAN